MNTLYFVLPIGLLGLRLANLQWRARRSPGNLGQARLALSGVGIATGGVLLPIALFVGYYLTQGGLCSWLQGVFVLPRQRLEWAAFSLPDSWTLLCAIPLFLLYTFGAQVGKRFWLLGLTLICLLLLLSYAGHPRVYQAIWLAVRPAPLLLALVLCARGFRTAPPASSFLCAAAAFLSLSQYPFAVGIYFCYVAPLVLLAFVAVAREMLPFCWKAHSVLFGFLILFAVLLLNTSQIRAIGIGYRPALPMANCTLPPCGIAVPAEDARIYTALAEEVARHSSPGSPILALPDCPQVYFLSARRNPSRTFYDFFDPDFGLAEERTARLCRLLEAERVTTVVRCPPGEFSGELPQRLIEELSTRFPRSRDIGGFTVRWK